MLRLQHWFTLSDPGMEVAFLMCLCHGNLLNTRVLALASQERDLAVLSSAGKAQVGRSILATVHDLLIERVLLLKKGTMVDGTLIAVSSSTKNKDKARDPEMHFSPKGHQWHFGMKAHIDADADPGLVHTVRGTSGKVHDVLVGNILLHGQEVHAYGDAGCQCIHKRPDAKSGDPHGHGALRVITGRVCKSV
jgi:IS5 family transposase